MMRRYPTPFTDPFRFSRSNRQEYHSLRRREPSPRALPSWVTYASGAQDLSRHQSAILHPTEDAFAAPASAGGAANVGTVVIFHVNSAARVSMEGDAHKGRPTGRKKWEHWVVFVGEHRPRRRLVLPGPFQNDPEAIRDGLQALYESCGPADSPDTFLTDLLESTAANDNQPSREEEA